MNSNIIVRMVNYFCVILELLPKGEKKLTITSKLFDDSTSTDQSQEEEGMLPVSPLQTALV